MATLYQQGGDDDAPGNHATTTTTTLPTPEPLLHLLSLPLQSPCGGGSGGTASSLVVTGCFTAASTTLQGKGTAASLQEIVLVSNTHLSLYAPPGRAGLTATTTGLVQLSCRHAWGLIRSCVAFRLPGTHADFLALGTDSGRIVVLGWEVGGVKGDWGVVGCETFGRSGTRRVVPGAYLAVDPKGRALMIAAVEKQKFVYVMNRVTSTDSTSPSALALTISSPLEAHRPFTLTHDMVGLEVGFENPCFACIEVDYSTISNPSSGPSASKMLTYYHLDLGLNHVVRSWSAEIEASSHRLIPVPGGEEGPGGVLVCSENQITWRHQDAPSLSIPIPRRPQLLQRIADMMAQEKDANGEFNKPSADSVIIVSHVVHKMKKDFFILAQTEEGDVFKVTFIPNPASPTFPLQLKIKYFETLPPACGISVLKSGYLFLAAESGSHQLYQIESLGDDGEENQPEYLSSEVEEGGLYLFNPRTFRNLALVDTLRNLGPLITAKPIQPMKADGVVAHESIKLACITGKGSRSQFHLLTHGLPITELAVSELPGTPNGVWCVAMSEKDTSPNAGPRFHDYIVVSFRNATLVLTILDGSVEERVDSGFLTSSPSLVVGGFGSSAACQVTPHSIRHIRADARVSEWSPPRGQNILAADCNDRQVVAALTNGELVYFEADGFGHMNEVKIRGQLSSPAVKLSIGPVPEGRQRSNFLAVACEDNTVRMLSLDPNNCMETLGMQATPVTPSSVLLSTFFDLGVTSQVGSLYLSIGLSNGILMRSHVDAVTGALSDVRQRFLGPKPVSLFPFSLPSPVRVLGAAKSAKIGAPSIMPYEPAMLAFSTQPWLSFMYANQNRTIPLVYPYLDAASAFISDVCPSGGMVAITGNSLAILAVDGNRDSLFHAVSTPLPHTPRRCCVDPESGLAIVLTADAHTYCPSMMKQLIEQRNRVDFGEREEGAIEDAIEALDPSYFGLPRAAPGHWASTIHVIRPEAAAGPEEVEGQLTANAFLDTITFDNDEAGTVMEWVTLASVTYLAVGTAVGMTLAPRSCKAAYIKLYQLSPDEGKLIFVNSTKVSEIPTAIHGFQGHVLVGLGRSLCMYQLGKKQLLKRCENANFPRIITGITSAYSRLYVSDIQESITFATFLPTANRISIFADDTGPRYMTCFEVLDYDTVVGADKWGNIFALRLDGTESKEVDEDFTGNKLLFEQGSLNGARYKLKSIAEYHVGDVVTCLTKVSLFPGAKPVILYTTIMGAIGVFAPVTSHIDVDLLRSLEGVMRSLKPSLCGRDHRVFRSAYRPVRLVMDGELCEHFLTLDTVKQRQVSAQLGEEGDEMTVGDLTRRLATIRGAIAF